MTKALSTYFAMKAKTVALLNVSPGRRIVDGISVDAPNLDNAGALNRAREVAHGSPCIIARPG